ncbi:MAG: acetyl-CoA carboxylase biotin carboxylase subunit [Candidatus Marinimicrobia bacterium]|jgi:acetyl-CoA carboxylase, biotin carboxylase subunit|nr:acetyl-CoA carboxylase biotin carboxylase subunit [Candidatus Neomarinimicrobiota bacterium]MBT4359886.1 acetyl-CoA carboxylase biotin carboxylase subunit [Candidatus Neomarinimicrobiota bacterium]MBT4716146.1 acetyl-CoA carboxylase biotin carboxylase subunit [Candidatus Neomarinimicrobiota bacterium]MBT4947210.1 acetyl-CoA carboxylase biotin carboxylase subunit [Candidatus Neomarinimicrobiota bacterium]MBT5271217.1 acetyl-CoA carboxylase biotin carboxylase subunit [Candidatus Neomarinimicro
MYKKILIANRGEIALRVIRACREVGISSVAVYSEADELSLHTKFADEAVCIGPGPSKLSYLNTQAILTAAEVTNADAIHPGYGFLAESADFANMCKKHNIDFIGPDGDMIDAMGDKASAKETMKAAGVPVIPGSQGILSSAGEARKMADEMGYPVILKATAGGGGRGMRVVYRSEDVAKFYGMAQAESGTAFGNDGLYLEKYIENPRHIEVQLLGDSHGNVYSLGERECSIQRRHQKLLEESPSPVVSEELRREMGEAAVAGAKRVNYVGAGTIEFLLDKHGKFYFMEMNTRIQVEHTVSEEVTGVDIVKEQIACHAGGELPAFLKTMKLRGHSIECRINAEDPALNFRPSPLFIESVHFPGGRGVRVDSHIYSGYQIPPHYDSMLAKLVVHGRDRKEAIERMLGALKEFIIEGPKTTIPFHIQLLENDQIQAGNFDTHFLESFKYDSSRE